MFEAVRGSAQAIFGQKIANPIGQSSGALMLEYLGHADAAAAVIKAIEIVIRNGSHHRDLGDLHQRRRLIRRL